MTEKEQERKAEEFVTACVVYSTSGIKAPIIDNMPGDEIMQVLAELLYLARTGQG